MVLKTFKNMKKIFSLFAAVLFAGSMMAAVVEQTSTLTFSSTSKTGGTGTADNEVVWTITSDQTESNGDATNGIHYGTNNAAVKYIRLATTGIKGTVKEVVVVASDNLSSGNAGVSVKVNETLLTVKGGSATAVTISGFNQTATFAGDEESDSIIVNLERGTATKKALYIKSVTVTYEYDPDAPSLAVKDMNKGRVILESNYSDANYIFENQELEITALNLTENITASATAGITVTSPIDKVSPFATIDFEVPVESRFNGTVTLSANGVIATSNVSAIVTKEIAFNGTPIAITNAASDSVNVDAKPARKVGSSSVAGSMTINVPAKTAKLHILAASWAGEAGPIAVYKGEVEEANKLQDINLLADGGFSGSGKTFEMQDLLYSECRFDLNLSDITAATDIIFKGNETTKRFLIWNIAYELDGATAIDETEAAGKATKELREGQVLIIKGNKTYNILGQEIK